VRKVKNVSSAAEQQRYTFHVFES